MSTKTGELAPVALPAAERSGGRTLHIQRRGEVRAAFLFILPTLVGFTLFVAGPIIASIALAFTKYDVVHAPQPIGLANFREALNDARVRTSFRNTIVFVIVANALQIALALALAIGVQRKMPAALRTFFRTAFFLPIITSAASISIVFGYMFNKEFGVINYYLEKLHIGPFPWLVNTHWSLYTVAIAYVWQHVGFTFILFSAGLGNINKELYEAADIDGVGPWTRLVRITLPLLSPTILFTTVIGMISALQVFDQPTVMTNGGPGDSSRTVVMIIYDVAFRNLRFGYGSAIAVLLFVVILAFTGAQFLLSRRFVFYR
jgi:multiple sugar transport system permease protein